MKGPWNIANPLTDDGRNKINEMFQELYNEYREAGFNAKEAKEKAHDAVMKSDEAMALSERTQKELSQAILEGDSSPLGGQLSVGADGTIYNNPQERLVKEFNSVNQKLAQTRYDNINSLKLENGLQIGDKVKTWGYLENGDGGESEYAIVDTSEPANGLSLIELGNGLKAKLLRTAQSVYNFFPYFVDNLSDEYSSYNLINGKSFWDIKAADVYAVWDEMWLKNQGYINRINWGTDESGTHPLHYYIFDPGNTDKTEILSAGMHGSERSAIYALYYAMKSIVDLGHVEPTLYEARFKTRFVVMPLINPHGMERNFRGNVNNVDINRNFNYKWEDYPVGENEYGLSKGSAPFSEKETQFVRDVVDLFDHERVVSYLDFHSGSQPATYQLNLPQNSLLKPVGNNALRYLTKKYPNRTTGVNDNWSEPTVTNWVKKEFGIETANPEWDISSLGGTTQVQTREQLQAATEWFLTLINESIKSKDLESNNKRVLLTHDSFRSNEGGSTFKTTSNVYEGIPGIKYSLRPPTNGIIVVKGSVVLINNDPSSVNYVRVDVSQGNNPYGAFYQVNSKESQMSGGGRMTLPIQEFFLVLPYNENFHFANINVLWKTTAGTLELSRAFIDIEFFPNLNNGKVIEVGSLGSFQRFPTEI